MQADDAAQEAFIAAWRGHRALRRPRPASAPGSAPSPGASCATSGAASAGGDCARRRWPRPTRSAARTDDAAARRACALLSALPDDQRAVVALCLAGDFSHSEAAAALGLPLGTVKSHAARGRAKLLGMIGERHDRRRRTPAADPERARRARRRPGLRRGGDGPVPRRGPPPRAPSALPAVLRPFAWVACLIALGAVAPLLARALNDRAGGLPTRRCCRARSPWR